MYLTLVKFEDSEKKYLFSADTRYEVGDKVVCDTCRGEQVGVVVELSVYDWYNEKMEYASVRHNIFSLLLKSTGATLPLKKILRKKGTPRIEKINSVEELERAYQIFCDRCEKRTFEFALEKCGDCSKCFKEFLKDEVAE